MSARLSPHQKMETTRSSNENGIKSDSGFRIESFTWVLLIGTLFNERLSLGTYELLLVKIVRFIVNIFEPTTVSLKV